MPASGLAAGRACARAGPAVRIGFPPAESLQTLGPSRKLMRIKVERGLPASRQGGGTESSNLLCSSGESANHRFRCVGSCHPGAFANAFRRPGDRLSMDGGRHLFQRLSGQEARRPPQDRGPNTLPAGRPAHLFQIVLEVLREPMFALLLGAAVIYLVLGDFREAVVLAIFATTSVPIAVVQETRTERLLESLRDLTSPRASDPRRRRATHSRDRLLLFRKGRAAGSRPSKTAVGKRFAFLERPSAGSGSTWRSLLPANGAQAPGSMSARPLSGS